MSRASVASIQRRTALVKKRLRIGNLFSLEPLNRCPHRLKNDFPSVPRPYSEEKIIIPCSHGAYLCPSLLVNAEFQYPGLMRRAVREVRPIPLLKHLTNPSWQVTGALNPTLRDVVVGYSSFKACAKTERPIPSHRLRDALCFLGMDPNRFNDEVRAYLLEIPIGKQGDAFDLFDLDAWVDQCKDRNGRPRKAIGGKPL